jgi:hypothetical protein
VPDGYSCLRLLVSTAEVEADATTIAPAEVRSAMSNFCRNSSTLVAFLALEIRDPDAAELIILGVVVPDDCSSLLSLRRLVSMAATEADAATIAPAEDRLSLSNFCRNSSTLVAFLALMGEVGDASFEK